MADTLARPMHAAVAGRLGRGARTSHTPMHMAPPWLRRLSSIRMFHVVWYIMLIIFSCTQDKKCKHHMTDASYNCDQGPHTRHLQSAQTQTRAFTINSVTKGWWSNINVEA